MSFRFTPLCRKLHRWIGLTIAIPMIAQGLTGTVLAAAPILDRWHAPVLKTAFTGTPDADAIVDAATDDAPDGTHFSRYVAPDGKHPAIVDFAQRGQRETAFRVWVDPTDSSVIGDKAAPDHWVGVFRKIHESFLLPMPFGRSVVGWGGIGLVLMVLTGVPVWWMASKRIAAFFVSFRVRGLRAWREWHIAIALWLLLPLFFQALSGVSISFPNYARTIFGLPTIQFGGRGGAPKVEAKVDKPHADDHGPHLDIAAVIARAQNAAPGLAVTELRLPPNGHGTAMVRLRAATDWTGAPAMTMQIAADGSQIIRQDDPKHSTSLSVLGWLRALHTGEAGGPLWAFLEILTGLMLPVMGITGFSYWLLRTLRKKRTVSNAATTLPQGELSSLS